MNVKSAAKNTLALWSKAVELMPPPVQDEAGNTLPHQHFVLREILSGAVTNEKAHRWLGWAQGWLVREGVLTLTDCKYANVLS